MAYKDFGTPGRITAVLDTSGQNTGNLTTTIIPRQLGVYLAEFIIYHMVAENLSFGLQAKVVQNAGTWGYTPLFGTGAGTEWWGKLYMKQSDELRFLWNLAPNGPPVTNAPILTVYVEYDPDLPENTAARLT